VKERHFIVLGSADALTAFTSFATEAGFEVDRREIQAFSVEHVMMECLRLAFSKEGAAIFAALASTIQVYLKTKPSRRVRITKLEPDQVITVDARNLSEAELVKLLPECREISIDEGFSKKPRLTGTKKPARRAHRPRRSPVDLPFVDVEPQVALHELGKWDA
jgi:hypothetical protein